MRGPLGAVLLVVVVVPGHRDVGTLQPEGSDLEQAGPGLAGFRPSGFCRVSLLTGSSSAHEDPEPLLGRSIRPWLLRSARLCCRCWLVRETDQARGCCHSTEGSRFRGPYLRWTEALT